MKLTKGRISKLLKSHHQTMRAITTPHKDNADYHKRSSSYFTRRPKKSLNTMNKTMCNSHRHVSTRAVVK